MKNLPASAVFGLTAVPLAHTQSANKERNLHPHEVSVRIRVHHSRTTRAALVLIAVIASLAAAPPARPALHPAHSLGTR
jgi:hypothetical protein